MATRNNFASQSSTTNVPLLHMSSFKSTTDSLKDPKDETSTGITYAPSFGYHDNHSLDPSGQPRKWPHGVSGYHTRLSFHIEKLSTQWFFIYLTFVAFVMIVLNLFQAGFIHKYHSKFWLLDLPIIVFLVLMVPLLIGMIVYRKQVKEVWDEAKEDRSKQTAWIGIVLSILLPVIVCEFFYLRYVAFPEYHQVKWTIELVPQQELTFPAVMIQQKQNGIDITSIQWEYGPLLNGSVDVVGEGNDAFYLFNTSNPSITASPPLPQRVLFFIVNFNVTQNLSTISSFEPQECVDVFLFDPNLPANLSQAILGCGNPLFYYGTFFSFGQAEIYDFTISNNILNDTVSALVPVSYTAGWKSAFSTDTGIAAAPLTTGTASSANAQPTSTSLAGYGAPQLATTTTTSSHKPTTTASPSNNPATSSFPSYAAAPLSTSSAAAKAVKRSDAAPSEAANPVCPANTLYNYYPYEIVAGDPYAYDPRYYCNTLDPKSYNGTCQTQLRMHMLSTLVTLQTSSPGTDAQKIIVDEGSIVGGILFFTWFLGIFVV